MSRDGMYDEDSLTPPSDVLGEYRRERDAIAAARHCFACDRPLARGRCPVHGRSGDDFGAWMGVA